MDKKPILSVIMPIYNAEKYLKASIECILNQSFRELELILVNDCSTDNSRSLCESYAEKDDRVILVNLKKNGGAGNARNRGIEIARGEYITFMDSDDFLEQDIYEKAYRKAQKYNLDMVIWGITEEYYDKKNKCYYTNLLYMDDCICNDLEKVKDIVIWLEDKTIFGYQWNHFYRTELIRKHHIEFEKVILYEDYFFNLAVTKHIESVGVLSDCAYHYKKRQNDSITTKFIPDYFELSQRRIITMYQIYCEWKHFNDDVRNVLGQRYLRYIMAALAKSYDPRSEFNNKKRKCLVNEITDGNIYQKTAMVCQINGVLKVLQYGLNKKNEHLCLGLGKCVWMIKEKLPQLFSKIRRYK
ncbi:glycosyltransferase family 2 protein [Blautia sp. SG-772]|nr:glycosyltransferase family 2 protein [Blautia sp. SG-772]